MYADPLTVTVNSVAKTLPRIFSEQGQPSTFKVSDDSFKLEVSHSTVGGRRERHLVRLSQRIIGTDPLNAALNVENKTNCYIVLDNPSVGFTDAQLGYLVTALADFISDSGNLVKFIGGEA
jgi:rRNA processing protein Krr1/Pno1